MNKTAGFAFRYGFIALLLILLCSVTPVAALTLPYEQSGAPTGFAGSGAPAVSTSSVSGISNNSATVAGSLDSMGSATTVNVSFEYGRTSTYGTSTTAQPFTAIGGFTANSDRIKFGVSIPFQGKGRWRGFRHHIRRRYDLYHINATRS